MALAKWKPAGSISWIISFDNFPITLAKDNDHCSWTVYAVHLHGGYTNFLAPDLEVAKVEALKCVLQQAESLVSQWQAVIIELKTLTGSKK